MYDVLRKIQGYFKNNLKHGKGIYTTSDGTKYEVSLKFQGDWENG